MFNPFAEIADEHQTDGELVEKSVGGDRDALERLILRHQAWIYNIAVRMVFQPHDAEEITQEVLVKIITKLSTFKGECKFRTWLYRIVANVCTDEHRKRRRFVPFSPEIEVRHMTEHGSQESRFHRKEVAESVRGAISELTPKLRLPILLKYVEGLSYDEIAQALDLSIGTVSSRLNRGHKMLAQKLSHLRGEFVAGE